MARYIGARYVTKVYENSLNPSSAEWEAGVTYEPLTMVTYNNSSYLSKKDVPGSVGNPAANPSYWVVTGAYNGQIAYLQSEIDYLKGKYYDIRDYGMESGDNIYDALFDLLWTVHDNGGGIVYFPKGTYYLDYTILIPDNTTLVGDGDSTVIIFDNSDTYLGCALGNGGSNITIANMDVEQASNIPYKTNVALPNSIGIGDGDFEAYTTKREHAVHSKTGNHNIRILNVNSHNCNYGIQIEPGQYPVSDVFIENHICESGMFSINPLADNVNMVSNVFADNIICDTVRYGRGNFGAKTININGLYCTQLDVATNDVKVNNFTIFASNGNRDVTSPGADSAINVTCEYASLSNGYIFRDSSTVENRIINGAAITYNRRIVLDNIIVDDPSAFTGAFANIEYTSIFHDNCNFNPYEGYSNSTASSVTGQVATRYIFNATYGKSKILGWLYHVFTSDTEQTIGTINSNLLNTEVIPDGVFSAPALLTNSTDPTIAPEPAIIKIDTSGNIIVRRILNTGRTFDSVLCDLTW